MGFSPEFFSPDGGGDSPFMHFLFELLVLVLVLEFIIHICIQIASNITVPKIVDWSDAGLKSDY